MSWLFVAAVYALLFLVVAFDKWWSDRRAELDININRNNIKGE